MKARSWYREFWAWFVLAPLLLVVVACVVMVSIAFRKADDVVIGNYYREGRMVNQRFEQDERAAEMALSGQLQFDSAAGEVTFILEVGNHTASSDHAAADTHTKPERYAFPEKLLLLMSHPAEAERDREIVLSGVLPGEYHADLPLQLRHRWYLSIVPLPQPGSHHRAPWRLQGEIDFEKQQRLHFFAEKPAGW